MKTRRNGIAATPGEEKPGVAFYGNISVRSILNEYVQRKFPHEIVLLVHHPEGIRDMTPVLSGILGFRYKQEAAFSDITIFLCPTAEKGMQAMGKISEYARKTAVDIRADLYSHGHVSGSSGVSTTTRQASGNHPGKRRRMG